MTFDPLIRLLANRFSRALLRNLMRDRSSIFMLHRLARPAAGINGHTVTFVREALTALRKSGAKPVPLSMMVERWASGQKVDSDWIAFTLDDGFDDQAELVREAFAPMNCPVTIFLITGFLDGNLWPWDDQLSYVFAESTARAATLSIGEADLQVAVDLSTSRARRHSLRTVIEQSKRTSNQHIYDHVKRIGNQLGVVIPTEPPDRFKPMTWEVARELERLGVEFGPHSVTHRVFSQIPDSEAHAEISASWQRLQVELQNPKPILAWPTGRSCDFTVNNIASARELGLAACVATDSDYAHVEADSKTDALYRLRRFPLPYSIATVLRYGSAIERGRQLLPV